MQRAVEEFLVSGVEEESKGRLRSAITLYFKAVAVACDLIIFRKIRKISSSHSERFRLLERHFPQIYVSVDDVFKYYQDTYSKTVSVEHCNKIKGVLREILAAAGIEGTV